MNEIKQKNEKLARKCQLLICFKRGMSELFYFYTDLTLTTEFLFKTTYILLYFVRKTHLSLTFIWKSFL